MDFADVLGGSMIFSDLSDFLDFLNVGFQEFDWISVMFLDLLDVLRFLGCSRKSWISGNV